VTFFGFAHAFVNPKFVNVNCASIALNIAIFVMSKSMLDNRAISLTFFTRNELRDNWGRGYFFLNNFAPELSTD
jgi:hypothetical protein